MESLVRYDCGRSFQTVAMHVKRQAGSFEKRKCRGQHGWPLLIKTHKSVLHSSVNHGWVCEHIPWVLVKIRILWHSWSHIMLCEYTCTISSGWTVRYENFSSRTCPVLMITWHHVLDHASITHFWVYQCEGLQGGRFLETKNLVIIVYFCTTTYADCYFRCNETREHDSRPISYLPHSRQAWPSFLPLPSPSVSASSSESSLA